MMIKKRKSADRFKSGFDSLHLVTAVDSTWKLDQAAHFLRLTLKAERPHSITPTQLAETVRLVIQEMVPKDPVMDLIVVLSQLKKQGLISSMWFVVLVESVTKSHIETLLLQQLLPRNLWGKVVYWDKKSHGCPELPSRALLLNVDHKLAVFSTIQERIFPFELGPEWRLLVQLLYNGGSVGIVKPDDHSANVDYVDYVDYNKAKDQREQVKEIKQGKEIEGLKDKEPLAVEAIAEPAISEPAILEPVILESAISEPAISEPAISEPAISEPAILEPAISEHDRPSLLCDKELLEMMFSTCSPVIAEITCQQLVLGKPCGTCGWRFQFQKDLDQHLDWHFQQNIEALKGKGKGQGQGQGQETKSRDFFMSSTEWESIDCVFGKGSSTINPDSNSNSDSDSDSDSDSNCSLKQRNKRKRVWVVVEEGGESCFACGEVFKTEFDQDEEEWRCYGTVRCSKGYLFHQACLDFLK